MFYNKTVPFSYEIKIANSGRARRRLNSKSLDEKALGSNLGQLARGAAVFDPNAYDGDGDGLVQDSTPFERPAVLSAIASLSRGGFSSEGAWGDTFDNWTVGKTNEEIAEIAVPDNEVQLIQYVQALIGAYGKRSFDDEAEVMKFLLKGKNFDFTPETITSLREQLAQALNDNPELRKYIDNFGIPPVVTRDLELGQNARMTTHLLLTLNKDYVMAMRAPRSEEDNFSHIAWWKEELEESLGTPRAWDFVVPEGTSIPSLVGRSVLGDTFIHEYGHFLHSVAIDNHPDPAMRDELWNLWHQRWHEIAEKEGIRDGIFTVATNIVDSRSQENPLPSDYGMVPPSAYAVTDPVEFVAEVFLKTIRHRDEATDDEKKLIADITGFASRSLTPNDESKYGLTPYEIAQIVVPSSPEEAIETLEDWTQSFLDLREYPDLVASGGTASERVKKELKRMKSYLSIYRVQSRAASKPDVTPDEIFDFSPETVAKMREIVEQTLIQQPQMLEHVRLFGMPPIFVTKEPIDEMSAFFQTGTGPDYIVFHPSVILDENWFKAPRAFDESFKIKGTEWYFTSNGKNGAIATLTHEYGHYINSLSVDIHPDRESRYLAGWYWRNSWEEVAPRGLKGFRYRMAVKKFKKANPDFVSDTADKRWLQSYELQRAIKRSEPLDWENGPPHVLSEYGQKNPTEMFAEGYQGIVSGDSEMAARVSPTLRRDIEMIVGRVPRDNITNVREVDTEQRTPKQGFASLSITREPDGTRSMTEAMNGGDDSPLDGSDWLKDATPREIAQALVPRTRQDAVRLILQSLLTGNRTPDPLSLAALEQIILEAFDHDLFDYSPDTIAKMEKYLEKTLIESPQFLWQVRRFGSLPFMATDRKKVKRYRDNLKQGLKTRVPRSSGPRVDYPIPLPTQPEHIFLASIFDCIVDSPSVMGVTYGGLFIAMNMSHRNWLGLWDKREKMPSHGGFSRRSLLGKPKDPNQISIFPENDSLGRTMLANFTVSFEGTIVHEWHHGWWSRLFGHKPDVSTLLTTQTQALNVTKDAMVRIGGGRAARLRYFFPNLTHAQAEAITTFARDNFSQQSLTQVPAGGGIGGASNAVLSWMYRASLTYDQLRPNSTVAERDIFLKRLEDYYDAIGQTGLKRLQIEAARQTFITGKLTTDDDLVRGMGANPHDPKQAAGVVMYFGYDPVFTDSWWKAMATDYPDIFGDSRLSLTTLAGMYAQKNPQETLAELGALLAQPDKNYTDMFVTPELKAIFLYLMGEHGDPFTLPNAPPPWSQQRGFPSRTERVIHARETVSQRASNSLGNVASMSTPSGEASRRITSTIDSNGHTNFRVGNYAFTIPGDKYMPDLSTAYTRWASESHFDMQQISAMIMGLKPSDSRPAYQVGNTEINALISGLPIETEEYKEMRKNIRSMVAETQRMLNELRDTETHSSMPLYHTLAAMNSSDGLINANVGDEIYLPLASFTPRVVGSSDVPVYLRTFNPNESSAVLKLAIGARVINSNLLENVNHNDEWLDVPIENITGGRFRVASRKERNGIPFIEIEHSDIFDTNQGKFSNVDPEKAMSSIKDMVLIDRGIREIEAMNRDRSFIAKDDPRYGVLTDQLNSRTDEVVLSMFGNNIQPPNPITKLSPEKQQQIIDEMPVLRAIPISSMDKRNLPGFTSTSSNFGFDRIITPERNLARASVRMLEENREYIKERQMVGTNDRVLDDSWITGTIERMDSGEITHVDAMDTMGIAVEVLRNRVRNQVSTEDATNGDIYNYQKIGNRLRQAMLVEINNEDIDSASLPNRPMGFASETSRTNTKISEPFNPTVISTQASDDEWKEFESERTIVQAVVYDIKGEKVVFGVQERHGLDTTGIKVIALNPYEITGLDRDSEKGQEMALDWLYANLASSAEADYRNDNRTEISALLYAATKGDKEAGKKFKEYAATGRAMAAEKRQEALDKERQSLEARLSDPRVSSDVKSLQERLAISRRTKKDGSYVSNVSEKEIEDAKITPNNLVLVRWSEFPPEYDTDGNVILYPAGNYVATDRNTVHFTLNHSVEEHMFWNDGTGEGYLIIVTLGDVLDANGIESLDNLYGVDTYFTPKPGEGLKIPKPKVIKVSKGENRKAITDRVIREEFDAFAVEGGPHYTNTAGFEDTVRLVARDLGIVPGGLHANRPHSMLEQINNYIGSDGETRDLLPEKNNTGVHSEDIGEMERNAILRLSDREHAPWSGVSRSSVPNPAGSFASRSASVVGKDSEQIAKELELSDEELIILSEDSLLDNIEQITSGELEKRPIHSKMEKFKKRLLNSIRIEMSDDGIPMIMADPNPVVFQFVPDKRDWSKVRVPKRETVVKTAEYIKQHQDENWPIESYKTIQEFGDRLLALVRGESEGTPQEDIGETVGTGWLSLYLSGLSDPIVTSYFGTNRVGDSIHDLFGHVGIGRGFDRHGEWANPLALISTLDHPIFDDFTEADKDGIKRFLLIEYAVTRIEQTHGYQTLSGKRPVYDETTDSSQWSTWIQFFDGDIQIIIDMLDDSDRTQVLNDDGSPKKARSSGFASISAATRSDIREIAKQDAIHAKGFASKASIQESSRVIGEGGDASKTSILSRAKEKLKLNDRQVGHIDSMTNKIHSIFRSGKIYDEPIHPAIDDRRKELLDSIRVVRAEGGMTMIVAEPNPIFNAHLPVKRDWASIELPPREAVDEAIEKLKSNSGGRRSNGAGVQKFIEHLSSIIDEIEKLGETTDLPYEKGPGNYVSYVQQYYDSLRNPVGASQLLMGSDGLHDAFGHFGTGRGYDRHGEWANYLALKDMIDASPLTDEEKEDAHRFWFREYGFLQFGKRGDLEGVDEMLRFMADNYDGPFSDILDIIDSGHNGLDDAPTEDVPSGESISNISASELRQAAKNDVESRLSKQPSGFASRRRDWKTNTHDIEIDTSTADSDMFNVDENGNTIQVHVPDKSKVLNPKTKQYMILDSVQRASEYIADGGNLSEVPDDYIMEAMLMNIDRLPGTKFVKQNGRFKFAGMGGGQYGALRLVDSKTGTIFGIKFDSDFKYGVLGARKRETTEVPSLTPSDRQRLGMTQTVGPKRLMPQERIIPVNNGTDNLAYHQSMNEIIAGAISEMLGFEPMPMRIVKRSRQGSGDGFYDGDENKDGVRRPGIALILEFAQSRYTNVEEYDNQVPVDTIKPISMLRLILLDAILANWDRNDGNILVAHQSDGSRALIPLDNGDSIQESGFLTTNADGTRVRSFSHGGGDLTHRGGEYGLRHAMDYHLPLNYTGKGDSLKQATLEEIQTMVSSIMVDYRIGLKEKTEQIEKITANAIEHLENLGLSKEKIDMLKEDYKQALINVRRRWEELSQMSDEELSEIIYENILARS